MCKSMTVFVDIRDLKRPVKTSIGQQPSRDDGLDGSSAQTFSVTAAASQIGPFGFSKQDFCIRRPQSVTR